MNAVFFALLALEVVLFARNELVFRIRGRRIREISATNLAEINCGIFAHTDARWGAHGATSYTAMLFDLRRWTYNQFYPEAP